MAAGVALLLAAAALEGQERPMERERPDSQGPAGVLLDGLPQGGEVDFRYQLGYEAFRGLRERRTRIGLDEVFDREFEFAPDRMERQTHTLDVRFGALPQLGFAARVPLVVVDGTLRTDGTAFGEDLVELGDVEAHAMVSVHESERYRAHVSGGVSLPTGSTSATGTLSPDDADEVLPYPFQPGSGTVDLLPALNFLAMNEFGTFGLQGRAVLRMGETDREYTLGDRFALTAWGAYRFTDWVSASLRVEWETWRDVDGADPALDPGSSPFADPAAQGGDRLTVPVGMNVDFQDGLLRGHRITAEWVIPVDQRLSGPQLGLRRGLHLSWSYDIRP